ncbi:endonuclease V [Streptomyces sp. DSM 44915]|uniref:Endonuclease V n=1 Tax=Streptomyces chisholmiae TaxID=3075540 RepID=A0ABU2JXY5_9ACTN|nr:endonuclease V [Streptomyces sp. DSM 44915]MDT0269604.1 endonuclease V [Streptomyces sp. DSM 44915]
MTIRLARPHTTPASEAEAADQQLRLRDHTVLDSSGPAPGAPGTVVVGVDVAYDDDRDLVAAAAVALDAVSLAVVAEATTVGPVAFPYVPGLLAFRELPAVLAALDQLSLTPDLVVCDGHGLAHPRRFGLASHLGVLTDLPTIGVAKNPPPGPAGQAPPDRRHPALPERRGAWAPLRVDGTEVGRALRTRDAVKPVYVSPGHRTTLDDACAHALHLSRGVRLPETTRHADRRCREALAAAT